MKKIYNFFDKKFRLNFLFLIFLMVINMLLEFFSIGLVFPLLTIILNENNLFNIPFISTLFNIEVFKNNNIDLTVLIIGCLLSLIILKNFIMTLFYRFEGKLIYSFQENLSFRLFKNIINRNYLYHINSKTSDFITKIRTEVNSLSSAILSCTIFLSEIIVLVGIIFLLLLVEPFIFIQVFITATICLAVFYFLFYSKIKLAGSLRLEYELKRQNYLTEGFNGIRELKIFDLTDKYQADYKILSSNLSKVYSNNHFYQSLPRIFLETSAVILIITVVVLYFDFVDSENLKRLMPIIGLYFAATYRLLPSFSRIMGSVNNFRFRKSSIDELESQLKKKSIFEEDKNFKIIKNFKDITFKNVTYFFNQNEKVLENVSFNISKGKKIFIVGQTGSGKSTILNLLLGLIYPKKGNVLLNNENLKLQDIIKNNLIGYVPQNTHLFDSSLKFNITLENNLSSIDKDRFEKIIKICKVEEFSKMKSTTLNYHVGEGGNLLSGGQKQRIGIARALYKNPEIIIFDEAFNALDKKNSEEIQKSIFNNYQNKTIITVSHDLSIKKFLDFDIILKVENNTITLS